MIVLKTKAVQILRLKIKFFYVTYNKKLIFSFKSRSEHTVTPGGCAQNTLRILQWLCGGAQLPHIGVFYGSIGNDTRGSTLEKLVLADGVDVQ